MMENSAHFEEAGDPAGYGRWGRYVALAPIIGYVPAISVLALADSQWTSHSPLVLIVLNTLFLSVTPLLASYYAAMAYLESGSPTVLSLGCGLMALSSTSFITGLISGSAGGVNAAVTVYNTGFLLSSAFHLAAAVISQSGISRINVWSGAKRLHILFAYGASVAGIGLVAGMAAIDWMPVFFVQGVGPTLLRQMVLSTAVVFFLAAGSVSMQIHFKSRVTFLYWYALALLLIAQGLGVVLFMRELGSILNWTGRAFQYMGGVCLLIAVLKAFREARVRGLPIERAFPALVDISEIERTREALRLSEEHFRLTFDQAPIGAAIVGLDYRLRRANEVLCRMLGYSEEELLTLTFPELTHPEDREEDIRQTRRLAAGEIDQFSIEKRYVRKDGGVIRGKLLARLVRGLDRSALHFLGMVQDVTEHKQMEQALREGAEQARRQLAEIEAIYKSAPVGMCIFDRNLRYVRVNDRLAEINGIPAEEHIGKIVRDIVPDLADLAEEIAGRIFRTGDPVLNMEFSGSTKSQPGVERYWVEQWLPLKDSTGEVVGINVVAEEVTERKRAEQALRESGARLSAILEQLPVAIGVHNRDGEFILTNSKMHYYMPRTIPSRDPERKERWKAFDAEGRLLPPERWPGVRALRGETVNPGIECQYFDEDAREVWALVSAVPYLPAGGESEGAIVVIQDITERKQAEEALRQKEEELRALFENAPDVISLFDRDLRRIYVNFQVRENTGEDASLMMGKTLAEAGYPDSFAQPLNAALQKVFMTGMEETVEIEYEAPKGKIWLQICCAPLRGADGSVDRVMTIGRDITERKVMEKELRRARDELELRVQERTAELAKVNVALFESERKFRLIAETVQDVFWMNPPGAKEMTYVSPTYEKIWGRPIQDLYRNPGGFIETVHPEDREVVLTAIEKHTRGEGDQIEYRIVRPDGTIRWISDRTYPVHDSEGKVQMMVGIASDITHLKEIEEKLWAHAEELERVNRDLSDFNHIAAHDLQEPLRLMVTLGDRLTSRCSKCGDQEALYLIDRMQTSARRASTSIRDIHNYSTVSSRKAPFTHTDLNILMQEILSDLEDLLEQTGAVVEVGELPTLEVDRAQMEDVFRHLLSNALKFRSDREPKIRVSAEATENGKGYRILVEDNGIGFDDAYLPKIFTPFQRLHGRSQYDGSGIGLALCRKVMERHGGNITARSKPNEGATFILVIPITKQDGGGGRFNR